MNDRIAIVEDVWGSVFEDLSARHTVLREPDAWSDPDRLDELVGSSSVVVIRNRTQMTAELMKQSSELKVIARAGVGLDNIDLAAADDLGIVVVAALGANAASVAEHTLGLALAVARRVVPLDRDVRAGQWNRLPGRELAGGTWGLLSAGATARATARLARGLGMEVVAFDPYVGHDDAELAEIGVRLAPLNEVVSAADVLSIHLPATPDTVGLVDESLLARMKPAAIVVNAGRGEVVDETALHAALSSGRILGAGLDVRATEPPSAPDLFQDLDNVVLTPHIAGITEQAQDRIMSLLCTDIDATLSGRPAHCHVGRTSTPREESR
ncbi:NAD(P)-dependent oxidoreductase [Aeromicrobium sp. CTD01-1L150]|uniref:NAD(P)-dependent oxidoreductase n=1 Tax=Aeromicrobium sp. CTD01-1L150 TaxID=3341830 RepID=UPI0035C17BF9